MTGLASFAAVMSTAVSALMLAYVSRIYQHNLDLMATPSIERERSKQCRRSGFMHACCMSGTLPVNSTGHISETPSHSRRMCKPAQRQECS